MSCHKLDQKLVVVIVNITVAVSDHAALFVAGPEVVEAADKALALAVDCSHGFGLVLRVTGCWRRRCCWLRRVVARCRSRCSGLRLRSAAVVRLFDFLSSPSSRCRRFCFVGLGASPVAGELTLFVVAAVLLDAVALPARRFRVGGAWSSAMFDVVSEVEVVSDAWGPGVAGARSRCAEMVSSAALAVIVVVAVVVVSSLTAAVVSVKRAVVEALLQSSCGSQFPLSVVRVTSLAAGGAGRCACDAEKEENDAASGAALCAWCGCGDEAGLCADESMTSSSFARAMLLATTDCEIWHFLSGRGARRVKGSLVPVTSLKRLRLRKPVACCDVADGSCNCCSFDLVCAPCFVAFTVGAARLRLSGVLRCFGDAENLRLQGNTTGAGVEAAGLIVCCWISDDAGADDAASTAAVVALLAVVGVMPTTDASL